MTNGLNRMRKLDRNTAVVAMLAIAPVAAAAKDLPLWEAGVGVAALHLPDYRGSDEYGLYAFPIPYFVYRGEIIKADRQGIRGKLFDTDRVELNISLNASLPVDSSRNRARRDMPDLEPSVEIGPSLDLTLWRSADRRRKLDFRAPLRAALTIESPPRSIGWVFSPRLNLDLQDVAGLSGWNLGVLVGPLYANRRFHRYFYAVEPQFATATRPAYEAPGGYAGAQFLTAVSKRFPRYWVGGFARWDTLRGAAFEDSPLVKSKRSFAAGIAIAWVFGESATRVEADE